MAKPLRMLSDFQDLIEQWDYDKNPVVDFTKIPWKSSAKFWWVCKNGPDHRWLASVHARTRGGGCGVCRGKVVAVSTSLATRNPELVCQWHPSKNGKTGPSDVLPRSKKRMWWRCLKGHEWEASVSTRVAGHGCPYCNSKRVTPQNSLSAKFPILSNEWHPHKNGSLTPNDVTSKSGKKVWWQCQEGHEWRVSISDRSSYKTGCPYCKKASRGEAKIESVLREWAVPYKKEMVFPDCRTSRPLPFDFLIQPVDKQPAVIEFQGAQHFQAVDHFGGESRFRVRVQNDKIKREFCQARGLALLEIHFNDLYRIPELLMSFVESLPGSQDIPGSSS